MIVDAHLDIGWNAISSGRGFLLPPAPGYVVSRSSLVAAEVGLVFATLYTAPARATRSMRTRFVYENAHEANLMATAQVNYYRASGLDLIGTRDELAAYARNWRKGRLAAILLMEGADPIETPAQLGAWTDRGVRIIGPAWGRTRYSGGTGAPGGLTDLDGGFGARYAPIDRLARLKELPPRLRMHFNKTQVEGIMGSNWLSFLERSLPE